MKGKSCSIDLISFYEVTCLVDQVKQADVISLSFSITFDTDFHSILPEKKKRKKEKKNQHTARQKHNATSEQLDDGSCPKGISK